MKTVFNILWCITWWWILWLLYFIISLIFSITLILNPVWESMRQIGKLLFMPYWKRIIKNPNRSTYNERFELIFSIIWFPFWLLLSIFHIIFGIINIFTIIGIPFAIVHFKLASFIIFPIWIQIVNEKEYIQTLVKEELKKQNIDDKTIKEKVKNVDYSQIIENKDQNEYSFHKFLNSFAFFWIGFTIILFILYPIFISKLFIFWLFYTATYILCFILFLNLKINLIEKIDIKNRHIDFLKTIDKHFLLFITLIVNLTIWYTIFSYILIDTTKMWFFNIIFLVSIIQIHMIILLLATYHNTWKINWLVFEFNKIQKYIYE